jgi:multiple sugar transport system permease protein
MLTIIRGRKRRFVYGGLVPILLLFSLIYVYPIFSAFFVSLHDWELLSKTHNFLAFKNYLKVFQDAVFKRSFYNTLYFTFVYLFFTLVIGLSLALFLNSLVKPFQTILEVILFLPVVTITVAGALVWKWMYNPSFGVINYLLGILGMGPFKFLASPKIVIPSIIIMALWKWIGINVIIFLAGLQSIPEEFYEAARIDGASAQFLFWRITLPLLKPTLEYIFVTNILAAMQVFTEIFMLTYGGPGISSRVVAFHIYETGFRFLKIGEASAVAFILFAFILIVTAFQFRIFKREELY